MTDITFDNNTIAITGNIDIHSAMHCYQQVLKCFANGAPLTINFAGVDQVDSSALAIMIAWLKAAKARNVSLHYEAYPVQLKKLADMCELAGFFQ